METPALFCLVSLAGLAGIATVHDLLFRRIPNSLVLVGMALGLFFQSYSHPGAGLFSLSAGGLGLDGALLGALTGLALFLPLYALRAMGAGDVKLLAMLGVWLGPTSVAWTALWTLLAGGVLALVVALWSGVLRQVCMNVYVMLSSSVLHGHGHHRMTLEAPAETTGQLPYAAAIVCGLAAELMRLRLLIGT